MTGCANCGRTDMALFRTNPKGVPGIFKCRPCIDGHFRVPHGQERELLDAIDGDLFGPPVSIDGGATA